MALPPSKLAQVISDLPDDFSMKGRSVGNMLKKQGVTDEELKFASLGLPEANSTEGLEQWTKDMLKDAEAKRSDIHSVKVKSGKDTDYGYVTLQNPNDHYQERIYSFEQPEYKFRSEHFAADGTNYLAHARVQPIDINGKKARTILEVQSDVQAANRGASSTINDAEFFDRVLAGETTEQELNVLANYGYIKGQDPADFLDTLDPSSDAYEQLLSDVAKFKPKVETPYKSSMTRKILEREIFAAIEEGAEYSAIPIKGGNTNKLNRSPVIQQQYETTILNTAQKIAKQQGLNSYIEKAALTTQDRLNALVDNLTEITQEKSLIELSNSMSGTEVDYIIGAYLTDNIDLAELKKRLKIEIPKTGDQEFLVIEHPKGTKVNFNLYAAPAATAGAAYTAYNQGYSEDEVAAYLVQSQGYTETEAKELAKQTKQALDNGYTQQEVEQYFNSKEVETKDVVTEVPAAKPEALVRPMTAEQAAQATHTSNYSNSVYRATTATAQNAQELVASQEVLTPAMISSMQQAKAFVGYDNKTNQLVAEQTAKQRQQIVNFAASKGIQLEYDPNTIGWKVMTENGWQDANPSLWAEIKKSAGEIGAAVGGAIAGAKYGSRAGIAAFPEFAPASGLAGGVLGGLGGGAVGAVVGSELDYVWEAMQKNAEMDSAVQQRRMINAAQSSLLYDVIGGIAMKTPSAVVSTIKGIKAVPDKAQAFIQGESKIDQALADTMFVNRDEANELIQIMEQFASVPGANPMEQRIAATILTQPGGEGIAGAVARIDPIASRTIARSIDNRAQDILKTAESLSDENLSRLVSQDLKNYEHDVKGLYTRVQEAASKNPKAVMYQFDLDKLAIDPVLKSLEKNISDPNVMKKYMLQLGRIKQFSLSRDFNDLLELRRVVNGFKYNTKITSAKDYEKVNEVVKNIDAAIERGSKLVMKDDGVWLDAFKQANLQYAKMMSTRKNVLYKALSKPGQDYDKTVSNLTRYITAEDSTFVDVMAVLPKATQKKVEGSVINTLTDKYTAGNVGSERAIHFPQLAESLSKITFNSSEARQFKAAITKMSEVFRNDVPLAQVTGSLRPPGDVSLLTSDLLAASKRHLAGKIFNFARRQIGDSTSKLVYKAAEVLANPLNTKSMRELMEELKGEVDITKETRDLLNAATREQAEKGYIGAPKVILYGDGDILSAKKVGKEQKIALHRIATVEKAMQIAEAEGISRGDTKALDAVLLEMGYEAVQQGSDKVRKLPTK